MKKLFLSILIVTFVFAYSKAQIADNYDITFYPTYSYTHASGTDVFAGQNNDDGEASIPIGFSFKYGDHTYTSLTAGVNGAISFTSGNVDYDNDLASADYDHSNIIAPLWDDLFITAADNGKIVYQAGGQTPDRWIYIEWQNISWRSQGETVSFKLDLRENGRFDFYYGPLNSTETRSATIGMNTTGGNDFFSITPGDPVTYSTSVSNNNISTSDYPGQYAYSFRPKKPQNNNFESLSVLNVTALDAEKTTGTLYGATSETDYDINDDDLNPDVWYSVTIPQSGTVTVETSYAEGSDMTDTYLTAFIHNSKSYLTKIAEDDNSGTDNFSKITLTGRTPGEVIYFKVEKNLSSETSFDAFNIIAYNDPPYNDACNNYEPITNFPYSITQDASYATNNNGFILFGSNGMNDGVWYALAGNGADYTISITPDNWDAELAVFTGSCGNFTLTDNADNGGSGETETLTFSSVDGEIYYINIGATSKTENLPEGIFSLTIEESCEPTTFTVPLPAETNACEGDDVVLQVEASGSGLTNDSYSWYQENGSLGIHGTTLTISNAQISDSYNYTCKVTNACGEIASSTTNLIVNSNVTITNQPQDVNATVGDDVTFSVTAEGTDLNYQWKKDGNDISGATNAQLVLTNVSENDEGTYSVVVTGTCGSETSNDAVLSLSSGISQNEKSIIELFPNPVNNILCLTSKEKIHSVSITDISGKELYFQTINNLYPKIDVSRFKKGIYFINIKTKNRNTILKFIKQ